MLGLSTPPLFSSLQINIKLNPLESTFAHVSFIVEESSAVGAAEHPPSLLNIPQSEL